MHSIYSMYFLGLGILLQAIYLSSSYLGQRKFQLIFGIIILASIISGLLLRDKHEISYNLHQHVIYVLFIFICLFSAYFSRYILPNINNQTVIIMTAIFLFSFYVHFLPKYLEFFSSPLTMGGVQVSVDGLNGAVTVIVLYVSYFIFNFDNLIVLSVALLALRYFYGSTYNLKLKERQS